MHNAAAARMVCLETHALNALITTAGLNRDQDAATFAGRLLSRKRRDLEVAQADVQRGFGELARLYRQLGAVIEDNQLNDLEDSASDVEAASTATPPRAFPRRILNRNKAPEPSAPEPSAPEPSAHSRGAVGTHKRKRSPASVCINKCNIGQVNIGAEGAFENIRGFFDAGGQARASVDLEDRDGEDRRSVDCDGVPHVD